MMNCKCRHCTTVLAIIVLVFSFWQVPWNISWLTSKWIIVAAAVLILLHGLGCHTCNDHMCKTTPMRKSSSKKKTAKRKKRR